MNTAERQEEIQKAIIRVMSKLSPPDLSKYYQSISFVGLREMLADIPSDEFIEALKNIDGMHISDSSMEKIQIPTRHFK